ncbi:MAG: hypothetical protein Q9184_006104 [Pyrenodesmia sp. 2 TL-2023]
MHFSQVLAVAALAATSIYASPVQELDARTDNLTPEQCAKVVKIVELLKVHKATPFCSSFLSIKPVTSTFTVTATATSTITSGTASTSLIFKPGNPPTNVRREAEVNAALEPRDATPTVPPYIKNYESSSISSACSCLITPTASPLGTVTTTQTVTTSQTVAPPVVTSTLYPCATPIPIRIPTFPFGDPNDDVIFPDTYTERFYLDTVGGTLEGCCNLCYFGLQNCLSATYYSYQGCVVRRPTNPIGTGVGVSDACPVGQFAGLTYGRDTAPDFRSQGNLAGPCGQVYNNL